jgi:hypothetical protein
MSEAPAETSTWLRAGTNPRLLKFLEKADPDTKERVLDGIRKDGVHSQ